MGTDFVQITTLVALTQKFSREEYLRPFTSSEMTETQHSVVERTWIWMPDRPGFESELCPRSPGTSSMVFNLSEFVLPPLQGS